MDDRVSRWLRQHWYTQPLARNGRGALTMAALARLVNWPDSLAALGTMRKWGSALVLYRLQAYRQQHGKVFTGAYIINGAGGGDKLGIVTRQVNNLYAAMKPNGDPIVHPNSMRLTWENLQHWNGFGSFIAGQVVADLRYVLRGSWEDRFQWAPLGPGSARGMRRLLGLPARGPMRQVQFDELLPALWDRMMQYKDVSEIFDNRHCEAMDLQNCLCEFDKYMRLTNGEGKVRSTYKPHGDI